MSDWIELRLTVPELDADRLAPLEAACLQVAPGGFAVEGADAPPGDDPPAPSGHLRYRVYVAPDALEAARARLRTALAPWPSATLDVAPLPDGWRDRWRDWFQPIAVSDRLWVTTPWHAARAPEGAETLVIEPGMAFGTGQHATTHLCLEVIDGLAAAGALPSVVLDVGCGSGVLAIAAARLGAERVVAVDHDPQAAASTAENARVNGVAARVEASTTPVGAVPGRFALVVANIMTHVLVALADGLVARTAPGGTLLLSGILRAQMGEVSAAFEPLGVHLERWDARDEWVRMAFVRSQGAGGGAA